MRIFLAVLLASFLGGIHGMSDTPKPPLDAKPFLDDLAYRFDACVFSGPFPHGSFQEDNLVNHALGTPIVVTTFYDARFYAVQEPDGDGRYGAVVTATFQDGSKLTRFITLYRAPKKLFWRMAKMKLKMTLPSEWGIDPAVAQDRPATLETGVQTILGESQRQNSGLAIWLSALSEMKGAKGPDVQRTGMYARDDAWWWELKKRIGLAEVYPHLVYLPDGYDADPAKKWPLILFLHGSGERGESLPIVNHTGLPQLIAQGKKFPAIIVSPQCPANGWWTTPELSALLDEIGAKYRIDPDRISVTGLSMGGYGTWALALAQPERFADIAPICGGGDPADAARLVKLPVWAFHGGKDDTVSPQMSIEMVNAIQLAGGHPHLTIFPDDGHNSWGDAYDMPALYAWMVAQRRGKAEVNVAGVPR